ncbi:winged helix-turn-helix transcriptional regulator [Candidatus Woesearchaeota archaeon]|nr:winged helix-turn-helix transcriptional regulator [Candidatus Woesearchaeota archaeon]
MGQAGKRLVAFGSKSSELVLKAFNSCNSELTQKEIVDKTGLSTRSIKSVLKKLVANGLVGELILISDMRRKKYKMEG